MVIVEDDTYVVPEDGYDICESCNYLTIVFNTIDHGDDVVPLCEECDNQLSGGN